MNISIVVVGSVVTGALAAHHNAASY